MNLTEIKQAVIDETRRVDKSNEIHRIVREAINTVHSLRNFPRDMVEDNVSLNNAGLTKFKVQLPPRFRSFECIRPTSAAGVPLSTRYSDNNYQQVRPRAIVNNSFQSKTDIYYVTGAAIAFSTSVAPGGLYMAYYALPETADEYLETWLMDLHPQVFIDTAKKLFYRRNGREDIARAIDADVRPMYLQIMTDYSEGD